MPAVRHAEFLVEQKRAGLGFRAVVRKKSSYRDC
jgi:hypothetical protein